LFEEIKNMTMKQFFSRPFNLVCEHNYPNLYIGPGLYDNFELAKDSKPTNWIKSQVKKIEEDRSKEIFSFKSCNKLDAFSPKHDLLDIQLITQTEDTAELELELARRKHYVKDDITGISNYSYNLNKLKIISNIKVPNSIDRVVSDIDLKATDGIINLYNKLDDVYKIEQLLSVGLLGVRKNRVLVPTRWAITSVDDTLGRGVIDRIKLNATIDKYELYHFEFYKNKFYILLLPMNWGYEQIESSGSATWIDFEINEPRKEYAYSVAGGYYAARLEIANSLDRRHRQARVVIFRDIDPSYKSKGVWVVREAVKEAMTQEPIVFEALDDMLKHIDQNLKIKNSIKFWTDKSNLLKDIKYQRRLSDFF
jgi:DNA repair protein NreA